VARNTGGSGGPIGERAIGHFVVAAGDQDGDGRPDLAVTTATGVAVVRTPALAGAAVDATDPADDVFRLTTNGGSRFVCDFGDLDGDGRKDLMVAWHGADGPIHVAGAVSPAPGADVDLLTAAGAGHGFLVNVPGQTIGTAVTVGDQNGDGRRDTYLSLQNSGPRGAAPVPSPALGTVTTFTGPSYDQFAGQLEPIGDQDGDGVEDLGDYRGMVLSAFMRAHPEMQMYPAGNVMVVGAVPDRTGDGRAERLALHADPYSTVVSGGTAQATYQLETYLTPLALPSPNAWNPMPCCGMSPADAMASVPAAPAAPAKPGAKPAAPAVKHTFVGTKKADKLTGTAKADVLRGLGGNDVLRGLGGDDHLDGGAGRDVVDGGAGNDVIAVRDGEVDTVRCGSGKKDRVTADRNDKVSGCEKVSRPKKKATKKKTQRR
jgi:Ca2+-binding RTX toxin-like protein